MLALAVGLTYTPMQSLYAGESKADLNEDEIDEIIKIKGKEITIEASDGNTYTGTIIAPGFQSTKDQKGNSFTIVMLDGSGPNTKDCEATVSLTGTPGNYVVDIYSPCIIP